jgi:hypothetical protein
MTTSRGQSKQRIHVSNDFTTSDLLSVSCQISVRLESFALPHETLWLLLLACHHSQVVNPYKRELKFPQLDLVLLTSTSPISPPPRRSIFEKSKKHSDFAKNIY